MFVRTLLAPAFMLGFIFLSLTADNPAQASECTRDVTVNVEERLPMARVEAIARNRWQREVRRIYGVPFSSWRHARDAATRCVQTETRASGDRPYLCFARGIPCKAGG